MSSIYPPNGGQTLQSCMRCGLPLLPDVPVCRNCGWYNASSPQQFASSIPNTPGQFQRANFANAQPGTSYAPSAASPIQTYQPSTTGFAPGNFFQQPPQPPKKGGSNIVAILLVIVALLLLIGSGSYAGYYFFFKNPSQPTVTITPTAPIVTPSVKPLFSDDFQNNANKWNLTSTPNQYSVSTGGGQMVLEDDHNKLLWEIVPGHTFSDFQLEVDAKLSKGDKTNGYGVYIRGIASQGVDIGLYYRFELYGDGTFAVFKGVLDANGISSSTQITDYTANAAIRTEGNTNHITIIAKGSSMEFKVNGVVVKAFNDSTYKGGEVALFVSNLPKLPPGAQASFTHLAIFPAS